jgi:phosphodiesterase/alkaline phosphatase D-like protein
MLTHTRFISGTTSTRLVGELWAKTLELRTPVERSFRYTVSLVLLFLGFLLMYYQIIEQESLNVGFHFRKLFFRLISVDRTDSDLQLSHRTYPWIPVWDDHEFANNGYRDGFSGMNNTEDSFLKAGRVSVDQRKMNAVRAYFEWMPIRQVDMDDNLRIWRTFKIGKLFDLIMLDTRNYDRSITTLNWNDDYVAELIDDAGRTLMGSRQEHWFYNELSKSNERGAIWRIIGNQIVFSRINNTARSSSWLNADQWDVSAKY